VISLAQALATKTDDANLADLLAALAAKGVDVAGFSPLSVSANLPALVAQGRTSEQEIRATVTKAGLGDYWEEVPEAWCDHYAKAAWGISKVAATKARYLWPITAAPGAGTITAAARTLLADGITSLFENVAAVTVPAGTTVLAEFEARTAGTDGNVLPGAVTGFQVGKPGLSIASPAGSLIVAGRPKETNTQLVARGRARFPAISYAGNTAAYTRWIVEAAPTVTRWAVDDTNPNGPGSTDVFAANAAGPATLTELAALDAYFQPRRGKGTGPLRFFAAPAKTLVFGLVMHVSGNTGAAAQAAAVIQSLNATIPLGGSDNRILYLDTVREPLLGIAGVYQLEFSGLAEETPLGNFEVVTFTPTIQVVP
jgi:hypothetical protein